ncbi:Na(+) H(+) antiporter [Ligilactobacillus pobuzihii E100301 = KCTC 13174]|uniref:Na(+) H(+) antiporter n=2 Tax=Ligilactobacillus pobuzihii TaxID=449659 RepID=A0A0R2LPX6_9LACO|nr:Na(+) H(+) antiporter [Ligilactobacillus pobuzihii E100301 = KCTC 13174]KRO02059.1 Na(+) H(+) antiporter [Ligilactobacillus pobuzihii]GEN48184.1 sodium:proton antiporter [Ligilactobacillus pobuzihii]
MNVEAIGSLCLILLATAIAGHFSARLNFPPVIGQLLIGVIVGPAVLNWIHPGNFVEIFSEVGVVILMFIGGLESDLGLLKKYLAPSLLVAVAGMIFPIVGAYLVGHFFGLDQMENMFLGVIFAATSVSISVEVLKNMRQLDTPEGTTILGAAVVDDVLSIIVLSVLVSLAGNKLNSGDQMSLGLSLLLQVGFFILLFVISRWCVPQLMSLGAKWLVPVSETVMALILCLGAAYLAEKVGLSSAIGAFFAGLAIGQTDFRKEIDRQIEPVGYAVFIPVFFVSVGLNMTFTGLVADFWLFFTLTIVGIVTKWLGAGLGAGIAKFNFKSSSMIGAGMISRGEMALIIAQLGFNAHLLSVDNYSAVIGAIVVTTLCAPFILRAEIKRV